MSQIIDQLNQARALAFSNTSTFPQVLRQVLRLSNNPDLQIQRWCARFFKDSFTADDSILGHSDKIDLSLDALDSLLFLVEVKDSEVFKDCIDTSIVVYRLLFRYVSENDGCTDVWTKLTTLKNQLISKYTTGFPLDGEIDEEELRLRKCLDCKIELLKFIMVAIEYGSKSTTSNGPICYCLNNVPTNHTLIKAPQMEQETLAYLNVALAVFRSDILITPLVTGTLNHLSIIAKRKPHLLPRIFDALENFDTLKQSQSNYETIEEFKLSRKYVDRSLKVFFSFCMRHQLCPPNIQQSVGKRINMLINRGDDIRKKNILEPSREDSNIRKRKFDGFINGSKTLQQLDYKNLYCLTDPNNELNNFDLTTLPQHILVAMTINCLNKVSAEKLTKALGIIVERYKNALAQAPKMEDANGVSNGVKRQKRELDDSEDELDTDYNAETIFTLPPPKILSFEEKKSHVNIIIKNFFKLSEKPVAEVEDLSKFDPNRDGALVDKELTKIAILSWRKDSWLVLLARLATRGMRTVDEHPGTLSDAAKNQDISNMIRQALFDHFLNNIHSRIDMIIEWLSEEWYSEKVYNEEKLVNELTDKYTKEYEANPSALSASDIDDRVRKEVAAATIATPIYNEWASKVLDAMIPFLEPNDRKIFIRLLSDLPYLNLDLVDRIKSLCFDPVRSKIGFLLLQFLIMYRPPVKGACINILEELSQSDQEDLREESTKLLKKYQS